MKKVLFVASVQSHIINFHLPFIRYFYNKGFDVYVATSLDEKKYKNEMDSMPWIVWNDIECSRNPFSKSTLKALEQLKSLMSEHVFDLIHVHTPVAGFLGRLAALQTAQSPVLYTAHGFHFFKGAPLKNWLIYYFAERLAARWTDGLITMNDEDYEMAKKIKRKNGSVFKVNGVGVDLDVYSLSSGLDYQFKRTLDLNENDFVITTVAELIPRKNHIQLISAIEILKDKYKNIKVLFVGDGILYNEFEEIIKEKKLENTIFLLGFRKDVPNLLRISDLIIMLSKHEGLPKIIMEAMACSKATIVSNARGNRDLVENGTTGIIVEIDDVQATANEIEKLYLDRDLLKNMGENASKKVWNYSLQNVLLQMDSIYTKYIFK